MYREYRMNPTNKLGYLIQHIAFVLSKQSDQVLQEQLGIGLSQFKILMTLQKNPKMQQRLIADSLGQTEASISRQIKIMTNKGLLQTTISDDNHREHLTTLSLKGIKLTEAAMEVLRSYNKPMFDQINDKQQDQLLQILLSLHQHTCQPGKLAACMHQFKEVTVKGR